MPEEKCLLTPTVVSTVKVGRIALRWVRMGRGGFLVG